MNGIDYLLDTNIIIYLAQGKLNTSDFARNESNLCISSITYIEALGYPFPSQDKENAMIGLCSMLKRLFLTEEVEKQTIQIRKIKKIKLPDAIIAATAMVYNLTLVTHNMDDFKSIQGLKIINPFSC